MGDFNFIGPITPITELGFVEVDSLELLHRIDRIFVSRKAFEVTETGVLIDTIGASDHPANYGVLQLK